MSAVLLVCTGCWCTLSTNLKIFRNDSLGLLVSTDISCTQTAALFCHRLVIVPRTIIVSGQDIYK